MEYVIGMGGMKKCPPWIKLSVCEAAAMDGHLGLLN